MRRRCASRWPELGSTDVSPVVAGNWIIAGATSVATRPYRQCPSRLAVTAKNLDCEKLHARQRAGSAGAGVARAQPLRPHLQTL
jgi:hypothetical protein